MYAIIRTGGKQYRVSEGDTLNIEKLPEMVGDSVVFNEVLALGTESETRLGTPTVENVTVTGEILHTGRGKKIICYKFKRRKNYRRKIGHRQMFSRVRIKSITVE